MRPPEDFGLSLSMRFFHELPYDVNEPLLAFAIRGRSNEGALTYQNFPENMFLRTLQKLRLPESEISDAGK